MGVITWKFAGSGNWSTAADWSGGVVPGATDDVTIAVAGTYAVAITTVQAVHSLTLNNAKTTLTDSGTLALGSTLTLTAGTLSLSGTLSGGTVVANGGTFKAAGGTLSGVAWQGALAVAASQSLYVTGGLSVTGAGGVGNGTISIGASSVLYVEDSETLNNATLLLGGNSQLNTYDTNSSTHTTLTLGAGFTVSQTTGTDYFSYGYYPETMVNAGQINVSGGTLAQNGGSLTNSGTISISGGSFEASNIFTNTGKIAVSGGSFQAYGHFFNTGSIVVSGGTFDIETYLSTQTLSQIAVSGSGVVTLGSSGDLYGAAGVAVTAGEVSIQGGTLDGVVWQGALSIGASQSLYVTGGLSVTGAGGVGNGTISIGASSVLYVEDSETLNNATLLLGGGGSLETYDANSSAATTLTLGAGFTVSQTTGTDYFADGYYPETVVNAGQINVSGGALVEENSTFTSSGTISVSGGIFEAVSSSFTNSGTIAVTGGTFQADSGNSFANTGSIAVSGGTFDIETSLSSKTLSQIAVSGSGVVQLGSYAVLYGTPGVAVTAGEVRLQDGSTLDAVTWQGAFSIAASQSVYVTGGLSVTGAGGVGNGTISIGASSVLYVEDSETLNNATLLLGGGGSLETYDANSNAATTLTLGAGFTVSQTTGTDYFADGYYPETVVNAGQINVSGGALVEENSTFTNSGTISVSGGNFNASNGNIFTNTGTIAVTGGSANLNGSALSNLVSGKLKGGTYQVANTGTIFLHSGGNGVLTIDSANISLSGASAKILIYSSSGNTYTAIDGTLASIDVGAALHLLGGHALASSKAITDSGLLELRASNFTAASLTLAATGTLLGNGIVTGTLADAGMVEANGGLLKLASAASGAGLLQVDAGATLELAADSAAISYNGAAALLLLDAPAGFTGTLAHAAATDSLDLAGLVASNAVIAGGTLAVTSSGGTLAVALPGSTAAGVVFGTDGNGGTLLRFTRLAQAGAVTPNPLDLGNVHLGSTAAASFGVANTATSDGLSENLDGSIGNASAGILVSGSFAGLAAGSSSTALGVGIATTATGVVAGTAVVTLSSDGSGYDGSGTTALSSQTVAVTGTVYAYAAPVLSGTTIALGAARVGGAALSGSVALADGTAASAYQERLDYALSTGTGSLSFATASGSVASGGTASLGVSLSTATAGDFTGSSVLAGLTSDGAGSSGLGTTALGSQTITVSGQIYAAAVAQLSASSVDFGIVHVGDTATRTLTLTNAATGALVDLLTGGTASGSGVTFSLGSGLASGQSGSVGFTLATGASGVVSLSDVLGFLSHDGVLADLAIGGGTVAVSGTVDAYATAEIEQVSGPGTLSQSGGNFVLNLGTLAQGSVVSLGLGVLNQASGLADVLGGSFAISGSSAFTNSGFAAFSGLAAGQDERAQSISVNTSATGVITETIVLSSTGSNASGYSGALASETLTVTGTVVASGQIFTLTTGVDIVSGGAAVNTINAAAGTLSAHDQIAGGSSGANVLNLTGTTGVWNLKVPKTLTGIATVNVGDTGSGGVVYLRNGLDVTLAVASGSSGSLTIYGGADSSVIDLGSGTDTVVLGAATEAVNAGSGADTIKATAATAGALLTGSSSSTTTLAVSGGGTIALAGGDSHLTVQLLSASTLQLGAASFITAIGSAKADTIVAGAADQVLSGGAGADTLVGGTAFASVFRDLTSGLNGDTIKNFGGSSIVDLTDLAFGSLHAPTVKVAGTGASAVSTLKVTDGTHTAAIKFAGTYSAASFAASSDGHAGTQFAFVPGH